MENVTTVRTPPQPPRRAQTPFRFYTSLILQEATGLRAATVPQLAKLLRQVPPSCLYYHTHHFLLQHHFLTPEPTNDFAYWVTEILGEARLGELLASVDTMDYSDLEDLRGALVEILDTYLAAHPGVRFRFASEGEEFFFLKSTHAIMATPHTATTLLEFAQALEQVSLNSLYFHLFESRLRLGHPTSDFSVWLADQLGLTELATQVSRLNPYAHTLEALRAMLLALIRQQLEL